MSPEEEKESAEKEFAANTSLHGLNRIVIAPRLYLRALWVLVILGSYTGFGFMFYSMIRDYFSYDTITDTKLEFANEIPFPAVTICNMNRLEAHKLKVADWAFLSPVLLGQQMDIPAVLAMGIPPDETVNDTLTDMDIEDIVRTKGFAIDPSRLSLCFWRNAACTYLNFTHSFGHFGNCYTFNADPDNILTQTIEGAGNALMAFVDIQADSYTESLFTSGEGDLGLKLLLHDQREPPLMDAQGIALAPGGHALIAVRRIVYENHVPPWGVCEDLELEYYDTYTLPACYLECRSKHVVRNCSCRVFDLPGTAPSCAPEMVSCVKATLGQVTSGELTCNCPVPCRMTKYKTSVSYAGWPNVNTKNTISSTYGLDPDYMAENGVVFSVYYEELNYQHIRQLKAMDGGQLASNIGGMMGLFIGASLLTLLEVWEYLWMRLVGFLQRHRSPRTVEVKTAPDSKGGTANIAFHK